MSSDTIQTVSPSTNKLVIETKAHTTQDACKMAVTSKHAFASWRQVPLSKRLEIVTKGLALAQQRRDQLSRELTVQMGRPIAYSLKEVETMQKRGDYLLDIAEEALADMPGRAEKNFRRYIRKEPVGPVLLVFAWNVSRLAGKVCLSDLNLTAVPLSDCHHWACPSSAGW